MLGILLDIKSVLSARYDQRHTPKVSPRDGNVAGRSPIVRTILSSLSSWVKDVPESQREILISHITTVVSLQQGDALSSSSSFDHRYQDTGGNGTTNTAELMNTLYLNDDDDDDDDTSSSLNDND